MRTARFGPALAAYAFAVAMAGTTLPTPLYPTYRDEFHFSQFVVTVVFATYALGVIGGLLLFGNASDTIGRRRALLPALLLSAASAAVFLAASGVGLLLVGRVLSGLSAGIFTGTATVAVVELARPESRGRATLLATVANIGGLGCGPLLAGLLAQYAGHPLRLPYLVDLVLLVPAVAAVVLMPETVDGVQKGSGSSGSASFRGLRPQRPTVPTEVRAVFLRGAIAGFAGFATLGLFTAVAPSFLGEILGVHNAAEVGAVVFSVFAASTLGQLALEKVPGDRGLVVGCAGLVAGMGVLASGLAASSLVLLVVGGVVAGFGQGMSFRAGLGAVTSASPADDRAAVASTFFTLAYVALALPVIGVGIATRTISLRTTGLAFSVGVMVLAAVAAGMLLAQRPAQRPAQRS